MARAKESGSREIVWDPGTANPKQKLFFAARTMYIAYGGAKGGGKTWAVRTKSVGGALTWPGIKILILRRTYPELEDNYIRPMQLMVPPELFGYNGTSHIMTFINGSVIKFGHWNGDQSELEYQGQEFDWIFMDEATQFTERAFQYLGGCLRGVNEIPKRFYLTCNPGGVGHNWVKRLFIDRDYRMTGDPESDERPGDYTFIPATVEDNEYLMKYSPGYLRMLALMPEDVRRAFRYGDWDAIGGSYFPELGEAHRCEAFDIPRHWPRYRAIDYGLDMLACIWAAVDESGRSWVYREVKEPGLIVRDAADLIAKMSEGEEITATFAPPDLWARQKDTGRTMAEIFAERGVPLTRAASGRVQGHMLVKEALAASEGVPGLMFFRGCEQVYGDLKAIQADRNNPSDCARSPHGVTHLVDAVRYYCVSRVSGAERPEAWEEPDGDDGVEYEEYMVGW